MADRFVKIPGQSYGKWKYETFGQMLKDKIKQRNKQLADNLDFSKNPEAVTDFVNPFGGIIKNVAKKVVKKAPKLLKEAHLEDWLHRNEEVLEGVQQYTSGGYAPLNQSLREGREGGWLYKKLKPLFDREGNFKGELTRGTYLDKKALEALEEGDLLESRMILSASKNPEMGSNFLDVRKHSPAKRRGDRVPTIIKLNLREPKGYDISPFSHLPEDEVILKPGTLFQLQSKPSENFFGDTILELTDVPTEVQNQIADKGFKLNDTLLSGAGLIGLGSLLDDTNE